MASASGSSMLLAQVTSAFHSAHPRPRDQLIVDGQSLSKGRAPVSG